VGLAAAVWFHCQLPLAGTLVGVVASGTLGAACHALVGHRCCLYRGGHRPGSFEEARVVAAAAATSAVVLAAVNLALPVRLVPATSPLVGALSALVVMLGIRGLHRQAWELGLRPDPGRAVPVLTDPDPRLLGEIRDRAGRAGAGCRALPSAGDLLHGRPSAGDLLHGRPGAGDLPDVPVAALLGRRPSELDLPPVAALLRGRRVLVTGAGGSIGSELCRQVQRCGPAELIMLDRNESGLHAVQLSLSGRALLDSPDLVLADLRDPAAIAAVFAAHRPQIVFHAAALKHLPLLQRHPGEAVQTNIQGTLTLLEQCGEVDTFINISTDKAADPVGVLGYSKRITERITAHAATRHPGRFLSVRFGNVLGSQGSVVTAFQAQIAAGGPVTVTHPDATRYFMTIREAAQLVLQAAVVGRDGEALVLDMGEPVRVTDLARRLARQAPHPVEIVYTGLRPGEKLHEVRFGAGEPDLRPLHPLISHTTVPSLDPAEVRLLDPHADRASLVAELARLCRPEPATTGAELVGQVSRCPPGT
jgi:nucleoside-diphosphate-sugar epimerase